jgi:leucyl aminopeptidase
MKIVFAEIALPRSGTLVVTATANRTLTRTAAGVDKRVDGALTRAMGRGRFKGGAGEFVELREPKGIGVNRVLLAGLGKAEEVGARQLQDFGGRVVARLATSGETEVALCVDAIKGSKLGTAEAAANAAFGARLGGYRFDRYRTKEKPEDRPSLKTLKVLVKGAAAGRSAHRSLDKVADGVFITRDLVSEPANVLYPISFAKRARELAHLGVKVEVLNRGRMEKLGMGALLGVAQGSVNEPQLVVMRWNGGRAGQKPAAFIGKGVTFDTGGISIKPSGGMEDMKWDMGGAGVVTGLMAALAGRKAKVNAVGVIGLVENMPSGAAQRPGDVVRTMSGQTIEVINTDAEGRLVLADVLWYTQNRFKPEAMIDLATLTGAIIVALGHQHAGLFSNDDDLADQLTAAGKSEGERLWRMPVDSSYDDDIKSRIADMHNVGAGRSAGGTAGAKLLEQFVNKRPWAHLDIAGVTWSKKDTPTVPKGGTAFGVRLLDRWVANRYER